MEMVDTNHLCFGTSGSPQSSAGIASEKDENLILERDAGIEPAFQAWEACTLPLR